MMNKDHGRYSSSAIAGGWNSALSGSLNRYEMSELSWETDRSFVFSARVKECDLPVLVRLRKPSETDADPVDWMQRDYDIARGLRAACSAKLFAVERADPRPALVYYD